MFEHVNTTNTADFQAKREAENETDIQLMRLIGKGDTQALRMLIARWQVQIINFFYRSLRSLQTAEDLTQVVFIRLHRSAHGYEPQARFSTYIFHIARNVLLNEHRRMRRKPATLHNPAKFPPVADSDDETRQRCIEIEEAFAHAITTLPENQRTALLLLKQQELSYAEIARIMNASETIVKSWIFRGRQRLRELLKDL